MKRSTRKPEYISSTKSITKLWSDDTVDLGHGNVAKIVKLDRETKQITLPRNMNTITYQVIDGPNRGAFLVRSYFEEDEVNIVEEDLSWWQRWQKSRARAKILKTLSNG